MPKDDEDARFASSLDTKNVIYKIFKPADCALRIHKMTLARKKGVKIEADSPDIATVSEHPELAKAGLKVVTNIKYNPRLMVYGVPADMDEEEIQEELTSQNLENLKGPLVKVIYRYPAREGRDTTTCVIEVSPEVRSALLVRGKIYIRFAACAFRDYVRILQCYRCISFGHIAKNCEAKPACGNCAGEHELKDCKKEREEAKCCNCSRIEGHSRSETGHRTIDNTNCRVLRRKINERISDIHYANRRKNVVKLRICHVNCQSLLSHFDEFKNFFLQEDYQIICMSETWLRPAVPDAMVQIPGYVLYRCDRKGRHGAGWHFT